MKAPYCHPSFAAAHGHLGRIVELPASGSFAYLRELPGGGYDASGLYPLWCFEDPQGLESDFALLASEGAISFVGVCSLLQDDVETSVARLADCWRPFKRHYLYDPLLPFAYDKHHRYELRQAHKEVRVHWTHLPAVLDQWCELYSHLQARHGLSGMHAFPRSYFAALGELPGLTVSVAMREDCTLAMHLWMDDGRVLWSHLAASSVEGYRLRAAYALNADAVSRYGRRQLINFGGAAGVGNDKGDGLTRFKRGFSNRSEFSWLFGKILNAGDYARRGQELPETDYFPAYRQPGATR
jgi:hypothetical protein